MLAANVCSADFITRAKHPSLFRVHEGPTPEKRQLLKNYLKALGLGLSLGEEPQPGDYQAIAQAVKGRPDVTQIHTMLLRSMQQAIYTPTNSGHFGLAYEAYTHFTSPIRRYPDLLVHRVIKALLGRGRYDLKLPPVQHSVGNVKRKPGGQRGVPAKGLPAAPIKAVAALKLPPAEAAAWETVGIHCSANERRADEASRDVEAWLKCMFMRERLGEEYGGTVRGERTGAKYVVGSRVLVQVSRVDLDTRKIDFRLVREAGEERPAAASGRKRNRGSDKDWVEPGAAQEALAEVRQADLEVKRAAKAARGAGKGRTRVSVAGTVSGKTGKASASKGSRGKR